MKKIFHSSATALLILLFTYAALSKLATWGDFRQEMYNQNFPAGAARALTILVPAAEILTVGLLLSAKHNLSGLVSSVILMALFTGYTGLVLAGFWQRLPCSCGGVLKNMSWQVHFFFNLFFLIISTAALAAGDKGKAENLRKE